MDIDYSKNWNPKVTVKARGRGAGKTYEASRWLIDKALNNPEARVSAVTFKRSREFLLEEIMKAGDELGLDLEYLPHRNRVEFANGGRITFFNAEDADALRGPTHDYLVGEDVQNWPESVFFEVRSACRPVNTDRAEMLMNFVGAKSPRILELLESGFDGTTG